MLTDSKSKRSSKTETSKQSKISNLESQSEKKTSENGPSACTILVLSVMIFALVIMIIIIGQLGFHTNGELNGNDTLYKEENSRPVSDHPCATRECVNYAAELLNTADISLDPCDDFHSAICKDIHKAWNQINVHDEILKLLLEKCDNRDFSILFNMTWPTDLTEMLIKMAKTSPDNLGIFGLRHSYDSKFMLYADSVSQSESRDASQRQIEAIHSRSPNAIHRSNGEMNAILDFEDQLRNISDNKIGDLLSIDEVEKLLPAISWSSLVNGLVGDLEPAIGDKLSRKMYAIGSDYFKKLADLLEKTNPETVRLYLRYRWIRNIVGNAHSREQCDQHVLILSRIIDTGSHEHASTLMLEALLDMKSMLRKSVQKSKWMDEGARNSTIVMLETTKFEILDGFDTIRDELPMIDTNWNYYDILLRLLEWKNTKAFQSLAMEKPSIVLYQWAFYSKKDNSILISPRLLTYPYASDKLPIYLRYGTISSLVLPHLINAIGESGDVEIVEGSLTTNWSKSTRDHYHTIQKCYSDDNVDLSLLTSINAGLRAYNATPGEYVRMTGLEYYSDLQMFFVGVAKSLCEHESVLVNTVFHHHWSFKRAFGCSTTKQPEYIDEGDDDKCEPLI